MPNICWVKEVGHDRFKCPFCLRDYQPWAFKPTNMKPNKLLIASCNGDESMAHELGMSPNEVRVWFVLWADTPSSVLERRMQEIGLKLQEETRDMTTAELDQLVIKKVHETSARIYFQKKFMTEANIAQLKFWNEEDCGRKWEYEHLLAGFWAATAPYYVEGVTPYYDNDDAITMWGYSRLLIMKQAST